MRIGRAVVGLAVFAILALRAESEAPAADAKGSYNIRGIGIITCSRYLQDRSLKKDTSAYINWLMGYITAYNSLKPDTWEIAPHYDSPQLSKYLDLYCGAAPKTLINTAATEFIKAMYTKRQKSSKK